MNTTATCDQFRRAIEAAGLTAPDAIVPLRASGHNEPFAFVLRGKGARIVLSADPLNRVSMLADAAGQEP